MLSSFVRTVPLKSISLMALDKVFPFNSTSKNEQSPINPNTLSEGTQTASGRHLEAFVI
jgi:hypothetical protein